MDRSRWFGSARALAGVAADEAGWRALVTLADAAAAGCADAAELAEVFVPYLEQLAGRWPDHLRAASPSWIAAPDARLSLARLLHLDSSTQLDALPGLLRWSPALCHLSVGAGVMHALPLLATLPPGHALDTLEIPLAGESRRVALDVVPALPGWVERLVCVCTHNFHALMPRLDGATISQLTLRGYGLALGSGPPQLIATLRGLPRLEALALERCQLGAEGVFEVAMSGALSRVGSLALDETIIGEEGIWALVESGALEQVRALTLRKANGWTRGALVLAGAPLPALRRLAIQRDDLNSEAAVGMAGAAWIKQLEHLDLSDNRIGPEGLLAIRAAVAPTCEVVTRGCWGEGAMTGSAGSLVLRGVAATPAIIREILRVAAAQQTSRLHIEDARLDDAMLGQIAGAALPALREVLVPGNLITPAGLRTLAASPLIGQLTALDLSRNRALSSAEPEALTRALGAVLVRARALTSLKLNNIALAGLPQVWPATLRTLELTNAWLSAAQLRQLVADAPPLQRIDLSGTQHIGPDALEALASAAPSAEVIAIGSWGDAVLRGTEELALMGADAEAIEELARRSPGLHSVRRLELAELDGPDEPRMIEALSQIALPALEELVVRRALSEGNIGAFMGLFKQARSLALIGAMRSDATPEVILSALADGELSHLEALTLNSMRLNAAALTRLLPALTGLRRLSLSNNMLGDAGARALLGWPFFLRLESLQLGCCGLGPDALVMINAAAHAQRFEEPPYLVGNWGHDAIHAANTNGVLSISEQHIAALAAWPPLYELTRLTITAERLTDAALLPLADSPHLPPHLDLILDTETVTNAPAALRALRRRGCVVDA